MSTTFSTIYSATAAHRQNEWTSPILRDSCIRHDEREPVG